MLSSSRVHYSASRRSRRDDRVSVDCRNLLQQYMIQSIFTHTRHRSAGRCVNRLSCRTGTSRNHSTCSSVVRVLGTRIGRCTVDRNWYTTTNLHQQLTLLLHIDKLPNLSLHKTATTASCRLFCRRPFQVLVGAARATRPACSTLLKAYNNSLRNPGT